MNEFWGVLSKWAQDVSSHWTSYTVLGSFFLYVLGYLTLRFHLTVLGIGTDLTVIDERYLFTGTRFLIYLVSSIPSLLLIIFLVISIIYIPYRILPSFLRINLHNFFYSQWQKFLSWWLQSNRLAWLGIIFSLLMIQLVMRQCLLLSNLLLAENLPDEPAWLRYLLLAQTDGPMALYFSSLLGGILISASIFYAVIKQPNQPPVLTNVIIKSVLGILLFVQLLLIPVNYGIFVVDKSMPRIIGQEALGPLKPDEQAWLVWEGDENKTFLLRKQQTVGYQKSLITIPKNDVRRLEISGYDPIFIFLFSEPPMTNRIEE